MKVLALDIGGAYTKILYFDNDKIVENSYIYFPIWKRIKYLKGFLMNISKKFIYDYVGITFTAELSDIFKSKAEGVRYLVKVCDEVFEKPYYLTYDKILIRSNYIDNPYKLSGANFVSSVYFMEKYFGEGILIDMGSTTTDIIPFRRGETLYARSDFERILSKQLVYIGYLRTPINTIINQIDYKNRSVRLSSEFFAIMADVFNILGELKNYSCETPDGKGKDIENSMRRVARLLCCDLEEISKEVILDICKSVKRNVLEIISEAIRYNIERYKLFKAYLCGIGKEFLKEVCKSISVEYIDMENKTIAWNNLPCLGIIEMILDERLLE